MVLVTSNQRTSNGTARKNMRAISIPGTNTVHHRKQNSTPPQRSHSVLLDIIPEIYDKLRGYGLGLHLLVHLLCRAAFVEGSSGVDHLIVEHTCTWCVSAH
jgi:hypothetical protein